MNAWGEKFCGRAPFLRPSKKTTSPLEKRNQQRMSTCQPPPRPRKKPTCMEHFHGGRCLFNNNKIPQRCIMMRGLLVNTCSFPSIWWIQNIEKHRKLCLYTRSCRRFGGGLCQSPFKKRGCLPKGKGGKEVKSEGRECASISVKPGYYTNGCRRFWPRGVFCQEGVIKWRPEQQNGRPLGSRRVRMGWMGWLAMTDRAQCGAQTMKPLVSNHPLGHTTLKHMHPPRCPLFFSSGTWTQLFSSRPPPLSSQNFT